MKIFILLGILLSISNNISAQLNEIWLQNVENNFDVRPKPNINCDLDKNIVVSSGNYLMKYDTLGNEIWVNELETNPYNYSSKYGNEQVCLDYENNIYTISKELIYEDFDLTYSIVNTKKFAPNGDLIWYTQYEYDVETLNTGTVININNNSIYITGECKSGFAEEDSTNLFLVSYDVLTGEENWRQTYRKNSDYWIEGMKIIFDEEGYVYVGANANISTDKEYVLLKYDTDGNLIWDRRYNSDMYLSAYTFDMVLTSENTIVMSGSYFSTVCFSLDGEQLWEIMPPSNITSNVYGDRTHDMIAMNNGDVILTGYYTDISPSFTNSQMYTLRISTEGEILWDVKYGTNVYDFDDYAYAISQDNLGNIIIGGSVSGVIPDTDGNYYNVSALVAYDSETGEMLWDYYINNFGSTEGGRIYSIYADSNGSMYTAGISYSGTPNAYFTKKYRYPGLFLNEAIEALPYVTYPNPTGSMCYILTKGNKPIRVEIRDSFGKLVYDIDNYMSNTAIDLHQLKSGLYFLQIYDRGKKYTEKLIVN